MKSVRNLVAGSAYILGAAVLPFSAMADTISHSVGIDPIFADNFFDSDTVGGGGFFFTESDILGVPKFDPSLGTLNSATISATFDFEFDAFLSGDVIDEFEDADAFLSAGFQIFLGYSPSGNPGTTKVTLDGNGAGNFFGYSLDCFTPADEPFCENGDGGFITFDESADILGDADPLGDFVGAGDISTLAVIIAMESELNDAFLTNVDFAGMDLSVDVLENGIFSIEYDFTPTVVPVPAAVWLFGGGLIGLLSVARRTSQA